MCLAIPGRLISIEGEDALMREGNVDFGGVVKRINLAYVPEAQIGEHVLVHVGFAIARIDAEEAERMFALMEEMQLLDEDEPDKQAQTTLSFPSQGSSGDDR